MATKAQEKELWKKRMRQVQALYEQERQLEAQQAPSEERYRPSMEMLEGAGEGEGLDASVSNQGEETLAQDSFLPYYGEAGMSPAEESPEAVAGIAVGEGQAREEALLEMAGPEEKAAPDDGLLLDAYWASYGDAATRALLRSQPPDTSILEVVIGEDDRHEITRTTFYPWRAICSLLMTAADGTRWIGTGWLVSPRVLVTAGHCVYMHQHGGWPRSIEVIPGRSGPERPFGSVVATTFYSVRGWSEHQLRPYDYGAIVLPPDRRLGSDIGWFGVTVGTDARLAGTVVNISGYPGDKPAGTQWFHAKAIAQVEERVLTYTIDTAGGQSGAPVWIRFANNSRLAVGIHTNGHVTGNSATRICKPVFDNIQAWKAAAP